MKRLVKVIGGLLAVVLILAAIGIAYLQFGLPEVGAAPDLTIEATPEVLARGEYLTNHVSVCIYCHSQHDDNYFARPVVPGTEGKGGYKIVDPAAGVFHADNITPAALGDWTDGEIFRAITMGVNKDGEPLFPIMPYPLYSEMAGSDVNAIIAYLRTLQPIGNEVPRSDINFPLNLIMRTMPKPYTPRDLPAASDTLAWGKYLATIAACHLCHTPVDNQNQPLPGMDFAGGFELPQPNGRIVRTANITPDFDTGMGAWDQAMFIARFKEYADSTKSRIWVSKDGDNTDMPWLLFADMTVEDLTAIYKYLRTVPAVNNSVERYPK